MRLDPKEHIKYSWRVHELLPDYRVEDVWQLPITMNRGHNLALFQEKFARASARLMSEGFAGVLFRIRFFIGGLFNWDEKIERNTLIPGSIRERYANVEGLTFEQLPDPGDADFTPVYNLEEESLSEIENATVRAAIHLGRVSIDDTKYTVLMTIYVKPKGTFGQVYMMMIKPFRLFIVYPILLKMIKKLWEDYLESKTRK